MNFEGETKIQSKALSVYKYVCIYVHVVYILGCKTVDIFTVYVCIYM